MTRCNLKPLTSTAVSWHAICKAMSFFAHTFLGKRDREVRIVPLWSARQGASTDIHFDLLDLDIEWLEVTFRSRSLRAPHRHLQISMHIDGTTMDGVRVIALFFFSFKSYQQKKSETFGLKNLTCDGTKWPWLKNRPLQASSRHQQHARSLRGTLA